MATKVTMITPNDVLEGTVAQDYAAATADMEAGGWTFVTGNDSKSVFSLNDWAAVVENVEEATLHSAD